MKRRFFLTVAALFCGLSFAAPAFAADPADSWPQWGGINRDHQSAAKGLKQDWTADPPKLLWSYTNAGFGYSSPAVVGGRYYSLGTADGKNFLFALDSNTGKDLWRTEMGPESAPEAYLKGWGGGTRSTPTVVGDKVVALDDDGNVVCVNATDGKLIWKRNLRTDFGGSHPKWGYSESPLVDGNRVIVCPGGAEYLVGLDLNSGEKIFGSKDYSEGAHYVSVMKHSVDGVEMYTTANSKGLVSFSVKDGSKLWELAGSGNGVATIPTPIIYQNYVYHTSAYDTGCVLVKLSKSADGGIKADQVYKNKNMMNHHGGVVLHNGSIFGVVKSLVVCQDFMTGEEKWKERIQGDASASVALADNRLYIYGENSGSCFLVEPSATGWSPKGKLELPEQSKQSRGKGKIWNHPVIAEGKLYLRDLDVVYAFDIKK